MVASPPVSGPPLVDPPGWSHDWRKGGPMLLAELTPRWSHAAGGRQFGEPAGKIDAIRSPCIALQRLNDEPDREMLTYTLADNGEAGSGSLYNIGESSSRYSVRFHRATALPFIRRRGPATTTPATSGRR